MMQAVILAGGRGQRLGPLTEETPKPLLPVGGKPFLEWLLGNITRFGFDEILILAGYRGEKIANYLKSYQGPGNLRCIIEKEPLGTAGALKNVQTTLQSQFFLFNGDTIFDFNYLDLMARTSPGTIAAVALRMVEDASRHGSVVLKGDVIEAFREKAASGAALVNGGVYFFKKAILDSLPIRGSLENDVFPILSPGTLRGYLYDGFFIDIGVPGDYSKAQSLIPNHFKKPAAFLDRDGTLNVDKGYVFRIEDFEWLPNAKEAIKYLNDFGYLVIVVTNQAGIAKGYYTEAEMHRLHNWINRDLSKIGAHIDAFYFCPHHPTEGQPPYLLDCDCRKPKPGLILRAAQEWNINLEESIGIGDKESDILAFERAGLKFVSRSLEDVFKLVSRKI